MAGHKKWSKVNRLKGALDAKRGRVFSRLFRGIFVAARPGAGTPAFRPGRRTDSMPSENMARPATGEFRQLEAMPGAVAEELTREAYPFLITTQPDPLYSVAEALETAGIEPGAPKPTFIPEHTAAVTDESTASQALKPCDDLDDATNVHANFDIPAHTPARLQGIH